MTTSSNTMLSAVVVDCDLSRDKRGSEPKVTRLAKINKVKTFDLVEFCLKLSKDKY